MIPAKPEDEQRRPGERGCPWQIQRKQADSSATHQGDQARQPSIKGRLRSDIARQIALANPISVLHRVEHVGTWIFLVLVQQIRRGTRRNVNNAAANRRIQSTG